MCNNENLEELLPIRTNGENKVVNARYLHAFLEIGKDFSNWMKVQIKRCDLVENQDYQVFPQKGEQNIYEDDFLLTQKGEQKDGRGGHNKIEYALSIEAAKEIAMMSQTPKGKMARRYFIECERRLMTKVRLENYLKIDEFCKLYGKTTHCFYGLMAKFRREFIALGNVFYISKRLAESVSYKAAYQKIRSECRSDERYEQMLLPFSDDITQG